jgi:hypothetical protein
VDGLGVEDGGFARLLREQDAHRVDEEGHDALVGGVRSEGLEERELAVGEGVRGRGAKA